MFAAPDAPFITALSTPRHLPRFAREEKIPSSHPCNGGGGALRIRGVTEGASRHSPCYFSFSISAIAAAGLRTLAPAMK